MVPSATGLDDAAVVGALDCGVAAQLLAVEGEGFRFWHALTAEAVSQSVTPPHRETIARAAFEAFEAAPHDLPPDAREVTARLAARAGSLMRKTATKTRTQLARAVANT